MLKKVKIMTAIMFLLTCVSLIPAKGDAATVTVDCAAASLQAAINAAASGTIINVSGICNENISISQSKNLITINGGGAATIHGVDLNKHSIDIKGRGIVIKKLTITGGIDGIYVNDGGTAICDTNIIQNTGRHGIAVSQNSHADIISSTIQNNPIHGINVTESSSARIGFLTYQDTTAKPNTIKLNGGNGVVVARSSSAVIVGNKISNNTNNGIAVIRASHADISQNTINANKNNGIVADGNSGVNLGNFAGTTIFDLPNSTTVKNGSYGGLCVVGSYVAGRLGTLNGVTAPAWGDDSCLANLQP